MRAETERVSDTKNRIYIETPHEGANVQQLVNQMTERRKSGRFTIERDIRYRVLNKKSNQESGQGKTVNISSAGILFTTEHVLLPGRTLEVAVSWPAQLNDNCPLKLVARGRVVRFEPGKAAIEIQHYEFRTQGGQAMAAVAGSGGANTAQ